MRGTRRCTVLFAASGAPAQVRFPIHHPLGWIEPVTLRDRPVLSRDVAFGMDVIQGGHGTRSPRIPTVGIASLDFLYLSDAVQDRREYIANADGRAAELVRILRANTIDQCELRNAVGIMRERGALTEARAIADQHQDACLRIISNMDFLHSEDSELWRGFIPYFLNRDRWKEASP